MSTNNKLYAIYRGDEFIDLGTLEELAERRHVRVDSIRFLASPSNFKKGNIEKRLAAYVIEGVYDERCDP